MTLSAGSRIGAFEVVGLLGVGGMGEVYRARDSKLHRDVALKVLPASVTDDPQRVARFRREAQVLASINHPNIGAIHGLEDSGGVTALILELVEGPTLADRIARGPLAVAEALPIATQIARALEAAHDQGIVHRDLKPANIKLKPDGTVKVLDFGLAKAIERADSSAGVTDSPTMVSPATQAGIVVGTAAYMSPEQARGQVVDSRADIWAFGCVLFEMLTATRAFSGDHATDVVANVLRDSPNWSVLPSEAQPLLGVLKRCIEKDPQQRLRNASDVQLVMADAFTNVSDPARQAAAASRRPWARAIGPVIGVAAGAIGTIFFQQFQTRPVHSPARRFELKSSQSDALATDLYGHNVALSPDGSRLVYTSTLRGVPLLVTRRLDQLETAPIAGSEGGFDPFFSPDGQQIGFATFTELKRVATAGGPSVAICPLDAYFSGASWGDNHTIVFAQGSLGLFRVEASGGKPERLALPDAASAEKGYVRPYLLPGSDSVLYTVELTGGTTRIVGRRLGAAEAVTVVEGAFGPQLISRHLIFGQADRLIATDFDAVALRVVGLPIPVASGVLNKPADGIANLAAASDGTVVYVSGHDVPVMNRLAWVDPSGAHALIGTELEYPRNLAVSPDGRHVALTVGPGGQGQIWIYDLSGGAQARKLTFQNHNLFPIWSPDGRQIAFLSRIGTDNRMLVIPSDGSTVQAEPLMKDDTYGVPAGWSPDGAFILFTKQPSAKSWLLAVRDRTVHQWLQTPFAEWAGRFSPDGRWLAYASDQTGSSEVWIRPFPGPGVPLRISADGGRKPFWSRDGKEVFYENGPRLMSARVTAQSADIRTEPPRVRFEGGFMHDEPDPYLRFVDAAPDGRILIVESNQTPSDTSIVIAQHWEEALTRK